MERSGWRAPRTPNRFGCIQPIPCDNESKCWCSTINHAAGVTTPSAQPTAGSWSSRFLPAVDSKPQRQKPSVVRLRSVRLRSPAALRPPLQSPQRNPNPLLFVRVTKRSQPMGASFGSSKMHLVSTDAISTDG